MNVAAVSYTVAALAFGVLALLLTLSWRGKLHGALLATAAWVTTAWAALFAYGAALGLAGGLLPNLLELARSAAWVAFLFKLVEARAEREDSTTADAPLPRLKRFAYAGQLAFALMVGASAAFHLGWLPWSGSAQFTAYVLAPLVLAILGIALVEQLYRNADEGQRWAIKYFCLGIGGLFAFDFYLYADAMLFKRIDPQLWQARGLVNALVTPLIMVSAARNPNWAVEVHVSRRFVFHTAALLGAGTYLLLMAAAGYYIRLFGGSWGGIAQAVFLFGAALVLLAVLFSGALRARLRVFLSKHFFHYQYDYREEWLKFTEQLSRGEGGEAVRERSLRALAALMDSPAGCLWVANAEGAYRQVARVNWPPIDATLPADAPLARFLAEQQWVIDLPEYRERPDFYGGLALPAWVEALPNAWLITPLILHDRLLGFAVLSRSVSRRKINWEDRDLLKTAGRQAAGHLAQAEANEALVEARQFESFNRLSTFVVHDLKNVIAQLSLMLTNAERHGHKPEFQADMLETVRHATEKMSRLLSQLRAGYANAQGATLVNLGELLAELVREKARQRPAPRFTAAPEPTWVLADRERLARVLGHLIQNAIEATPEQGEVEVSLAAEDGHAVIMVRDTGCGMDPAFVREQLFKPFASSKPSGMGIGAYECREYVRELKGDILVESTPGQGSTFRVTLPRATRHSETMAILPRQGAAGG